MSYSSLMELALNRTLSIQKRDAGKSRKDRAIRANHEKKTICGELKEMINAFRTDSARHNEQRQALVQRWIPTEEAEIEQFKSFGKSHQNTVDTMAQAQKQFYDDIWSAYKAPPTPPEQIVVKMETIDIDDKLSELPAELEALKVKERRVLGCQTEYDMLCEAEVKMKKKNKSGVYEDDGVSSNQG